MIIILLGAPASGKGTISQILVNKRNFVHISTGNILREIIKKPNLNKDELEIKDLMKSGKLISDQLICRIFQNYMINLFKTRFANVDAQNVNLIFDGFPRNFFQATSLDQILNSLNLEVNHVVWLKIKYKILIDRILNRRVCPKCERSYNLLLRPPKKNKDLCDFDNEKLIRRADDKIENIALRWSQYHVKTKPLINFYKKQKKLTKIKVKNENPWDVIKKINQYIFNE